VVRLMKIKEAIMLLRHQEPLACETIRVRVSSRIDEDTYGTCFHDAEKGTITIRINKSLSLVAQLDVLMHEWAHAMLLGIPEEFDKHGPLWGVCYARCYNVIYPS